MIAEPFWLGAGIWACLYVSDNLLTITCARLYRRQDKIVFQGSYEITPFFQADVNALRSMSPRFTAMLVASTAYLAWLSYVSAKWGLQGAYALALGALILTQLTVHIRHLRNWFLFRKATAPSGLVGRLEYSRGLLLRASTLELLLFSGLYVCIFLVTHHLFVLGGVLACLGLALNHYRLARRHDAAQLKAA